MSLIIEIDAWNIRERDDWGQSRQQRAKGIEPERWHWVYGGTCFGLNQRRQTDTGRSIILSRGTVMTRGGVDALREQLYAECLRHGLGRAAEVVVIADGAMWIWNLVSDRFACATQRLDFYHASQHTCGPWLMRCIRRTRGRPISGSSRYSRSSKRGEQSK